MSVASVAKVPLPDTRATDWLLDEKALGALEFLEKPLLVYQCLIKFLS